MKRESGLQNANVGAGGKVSKHGNVEVVRVGSVINKAVTRAVILRTLEDIRPALVGKLTRVSEGSFPYLERRLRRIIEAELESHPTNGATIRLGGF